MARMLCFLLLSATLALWGCESPEPPEAKTAPQQAVKSVPSAKVEPTGETAPTGAHATTATDRAGQSGGQETMQKQATGETAEKAVVTKGEQASTIVPTNTAVVEKKQAPSDETVKKAQESAETVKQAAVPGELILAASYGNVNFPHGMHADSYECATCHGQTTPAAFGINKEIAHKLCKDCHKQAGAGPTGCTGCHKK